MFTVAIHPIAFTAIENDPISMCAFCSENHASVRWMVHENLNRLSFDDPKRTDTIRIEFQCHDPGNNMVSSTVWYPIIVS